MEFHLDKLLMLVSKSSLKTATSIFCGFCNTVTATAAGCGHEGLQRRKDSLILRL